MNPWKHSVTFSRKILANELQIDSYKIVKNTVRIQIPSAKKPSAKKPTGDGHSPTPTAAPTSVSQDPTASSSNCNVNHGDNGVSETPVARNLRVDERGIYVDIEGREHFFTWDQFEQFLLDPRNTEHLPPDDVVRRTADILRENKKAKA
ncbi:hypothetical protein BT69DRAFT_1325187 [Atractiella rhizophila]|nr:hypothetical protein BT69DRAFT_1325187 [Atractiella rhizophila]